MYKLNYNPIVGSTINLQLSFRDNFGNYYVPAYVKYSFLALNSDKKTWSIVSDLQDKLISPASVVTLVISSQENVAVPFDTNIRKIIVTWEAYLHGELLSFTDVVDFEISPLPHVTNLKDSVPETPVLGSINVEQGVVKFSSPVSSFVFKIDDNITETQSNSALTEYSFDISALVPGEHLWTVSEVQSLLPNMVFEDASGLLTVAEPEYLSTESILLTDPTTQSLDGSTDLSGALASIVSEVQALKEQVTPGEGNNSSGA